MSTDRNPERPQIDSAGIASRDFTGSIQGDAPPAGRSHHRVPDAIAHRYLRINNRYFFPDRTLAFIDDGRRIRVRTENREVLHSVVAVVEARGWRVIELKGTDIFRQGMWREAALRDIETRGYEPTQAEVLQMQRERVKLQHSHETGWDSRPAASGHNASRHPSDMPQDTRPLRDGSRPPIKGMLVAAAAAPYQFDPTQRMSFYATVRTETGDRTIWGADLERALAESASTPRLGDRVVLTQHGTRPVNVRMGTRNAESELGGARKIVAQRARWSIETQDPLRPMEHRAPRLRAGDRLDDEALGWHSAQVTAAANLKLAEQYARRVTGDQASQQRVVQLIRERMADALKHGRAIHLPGRRVQSTPEHVRQRLPRGPQELIHERS